MRWMVGLAAMAAALVIGGSCAHDGGAPRVPELRAPGGGNVMTVASPAGVQITIDGKAAAGAAAVAYGRASLIPVRITIENRGRRAVEVRPSEFALVGRAGQRYPALLAPEVVAASVPPPPLVAAPTFASDLNDQPVIAVSGPPPIYPVPATATWETSFPQASASRHFKGYRGDRAGLAARISSEILPEQTLASGQSASGVVYFSSAAAHDETVALRADLTEAEGGQLIGRTYVPMRVVR
jgi:hypothetical protein